MNKVFAVHPNDDEYFCTYVKVRIATIFSIPIADFVIDCLITSAISLEAKIDSKVDRH